MRDAADAQRPGLLVPRLADAVAVDHATGEIGDSVGQRHHRHDGRRGRDRGRPTTATATASLGPTPSKEHRGRRYERRGRPRARAPAHDPRRRASSKRWPTGLDPFGRSLLHLRHGALGKGERVAVDLQGSWPLITGTLTLSMPSVSALAAGQACARASSLHNANLSRTLAHETSRRISTVEALALAHAQAPRQARSGAQSNPGAEPDCDLESLQIGHALTRLHKRKRRPAQPADADRSGRRCPLSDRPP